MARTRRPNKGMLAHGFQASSSELVNCRRESSYYHVLWQICNVVGHTGVESIVRSYQRAKQLPRIMSRSPKSVGIPVIREYDLNVTVVAVPPVSAT